MNTLHLSRYAAMIGALATCSLSWGNPYETLLANGLRVIVKEDHRAPSAVHMVWYRAGSFDETTGTTGVAHVLEHMMFKGTKNVPGGEFSKQVAALGGRENAFTSRDYTAYFQIVPKAALPQVMRMEADRMHNLQINAKDFAPEIKVVMEERRLRTDDNPRALVGEALNAAAFTASPYRWPVIGWMNDLLNMRWQDAHAWYQRWYAPNNAVLVVVGDVEHQQVFALAAKTYGAIKAQTLPERKSHIEPPQIGERRVTIKAPAKLPYLVMAWKVPRLRAVDSDREPYALQVLAYVLAGHDAARFPRHLVRSKKIAQSADTSYDATLRGDSLFEIDGDPAQGKTVAELEAALRQEIKNIQDNGVAADELARVKTQLIAGQTYKRDSMMAQAMEIGGMEVIGMSWRDIDKIIANLSTVSAAEVQAVAKKYLVDDGLTVAILDPQPIADTPPAPARAAAALH